MWRIYEGGGERGCAYNSNVDLWCVHGVDKVIIIEEKF